MVDTFTFSLVLFHSLYSAVNDLVSCLKTQKQKLAKSNTSNDSNIGDQLTQTTHTLQSKLNLITECVENMEREQIPSLQDEVLDSIDDATKTITQKMYDEFKSVAITTARDQRVHSQEIINSITTLIQKQQKQDINHSKKRVPISLNTDCLQQIHSKLSDLDHQTKSLHEQIQEIQTQDGQQRDVQKRDLQKRDLQRTQQQSLLNDLNQDGPNDLSPLHAVSTVSSRTRNERNLNVNTKRTNARNENQDEEAIITKISAILPDVIREVLLQNPPNRNLLEMINLRITDLDGAVQKLNQTQTQKQYPLESDDAISRMSTSLDAVHSKMDDIIDAMESMAIEQQQIRREQKLASPLNPMRSQFEKIWSEETLSSAIFLNRISDLEQRIESKIAQIGDQQVNFQKLVMEQLRQITWYHQDSRHGNGPNGHGFNGLNGSGSQQQSELSEALRRNNLSQWVTIQRIDRNVVDVQHEVQALKQQQNQQNGYRHNQLHQTQKPSISSHHSNRSVHSSRSVPTVPCQQEDVVSKVNRSNYGSWSHSGSPTPDGITRSRPVRDREVHKEAHREVPQWLHAPTPPTEYTQYGTKSLKSVRRSECGNESGCGKIPEDCDTIPKWEGMSIVQKQKYCSLLMNRLFARELYEQRIEMKNSFYLEFARKVLEDWKEKGKWDEGNFDRMDEKKELVSKFWSFLMRYWKQCVRQT